MNDGLLEEKLKELYAQVPPPPKGLTPGRQRMLAVAARSAATPPVAHRNRNRNRSWTMSLAFRAISIVLALLVGTAALGTGVVGVSAESLPGDLLYPVKLAVEDVQLALIRDPAAEARQTLAFVDERLEEIGALAQAGVEVPGEVVQRMEQQMNQLMTQIALSRPEEVQPLLAQVQERVQVRTQLMGQSQQLQAAGPGNGQPMLQTALQAAHRFYQEVESAQDDPEPVLSPYRYRYYGENTPGPADDIEPGEGHQQPYTEQRNEYGEPTPACEDCDPVQIQDRDRVQGRTQPYQTPDPDCGEDCSPEPPGQGNQGQGPAYGGGGDGSQGSK